MASPGFYSGFFFYLSGNLGSSVNTAEQYVKKLAGLNQNAKASAEVADTIGSFVTAMQDMGDAIPAEVHDTIMAAYRTFEAGGTNNNAFTVMQTALQSIDSAIGTQLVSGGDVTGLLALRSRMESGLGGTVRGKSAVNAKAMADAVDMLMRLPADIQAAIDVDALSKAYFDYLTAGKADKAAAQGKAVDLLFDSVQGAIETGKLDAATVQKLEGLMAEIDSKRGVGDNGSEGITSIIDGIKIIDGKVGGKIPLNEYKVIRKSSIKNPDADSITFGKYTPTIENGIEDWSKPGPDSYIARAGKDSSYFDLGNEYGRIQKQYSLSNEEMFDYINRPAIDDAIRKRKIIRFSHNPLDYDTGALPAEWDYIKRKLSLTDKNLSFEGGFWYVK